MDLVKTFKISLDLDSILLILLLLVGVELSLYSGVKLSIRSFCFILAKVCLCYVLCSQVEYGIICFISKKNDIFRFSNNYLFCSDVFLKIKLHLNLRVDILLLDKTDYCSTDKKMCQVHHPG